MAPAQRAAMRRTHSSKLPLRSLFSFALVTLAACAAPVGNDDEGAQRASAASTISAPDAASILALVNYPDTDLALLDSAVKLDARAAKNIVTARNGADGVTPSADDEPFATIAALSAVPYVGTAALAKLQAYAMAHAAPKGEVAQGVAFTGWQSVAVVWGVNHSDVAQMDAFLDVRAARALVAAHPFSSVAQMAPVASVGVKTLTLLRDHAQAWWAASKAAPPGGACVATFQSAVTPYLPDLLFLSESDRPLDVVAFPGAGGAAPTAASVLALVKAQAGSTTETRDPANYFGDLEPSSSGASPSAAAAVQSAFAAQLTDVVYIAVLPPKGSVDQSLVDVYLVGRTACGDLVGLHAIAVET